MNQHGQDDVLQAMKKYGIPETRENYLDLAYMGNPPEMTAELEANLPPEIQQLRQKNQLSTGGTVKLGGQSETSGRWSDVKAAYPQLTEDSLEYWETIT